MIMLAVAANVSSSYSLYGQDLASELTRQEIKEEPLSEDAVRKYIGGRGLGAKILLEEFEPGLDPSEWKTKW